MTKKSCFAVIIVAFSVMLVGCGKTTIELNKYVQITADGYDTAGKATVKIDEKGFENNYYGKIEDSDGKAVDTRIFWRDCIAGELDKAEGLSNGETINWKWNCRDKKAEVDYDAILEYSDISYPINSLTELKPYNPFSCLVIKFSQDEENLKLCKIQLVGGNKETDYINFDVDTSKNYKIGDTYVVYASVSNGKMLEFTDKFGEYLDPAQMEFTITEEDID